MILLVHNYKFVCNIRCILFVGQLLAVNVWPRSDVFSFGDDLATPPKLLGIASCGAASVGSIFSLKK